MITDTHLKLAGVDGEAIHKDHKNEIAVIKWNWGASQASSAGVGGGSGKGKATPGDFNFLHAYDKASPVLAKNCVNGKHFDDAVITCRKAGEGQQDFLKITLKQVLVTSVQPTADKDGEVLEQVSMSYHDVEFEYKPQDDKGALGGAVKFGWNIDTTETR